jgi:polyphosphate glucokinase
MEILGIDIGGSGIKGGIVNTETGEMLTARHRIPTPQPAKPKAVAKVVGELARHFHWSGLIGCGFPAVVRHGVAHTASNIDKSWIGKNVEEIFAEETGCRTMVMNDADAAGMAVMRFGAGKGFQGVVLVVTVGTGLGTVLFTDGVLVPNLEMGHIMLKGMDAEKFASDSARQREGISWEEWGKRFNKYLKRIEALLWPDLVIIGGGASKKFDLYSHLINVEAKVMPSQMLNHAGIIGAAAGAEARFPKEAFL